ncbi:hypothetical protein SUGI_0593470 [Cryptomeria japonica]|nr:hypothetical protein SUGI_0593470 [Cryptomeria japonica]
MSVPLGSHEEVRKVMNRFREIEKKQLNMISSANFYDNILRKWPGSERTSRQTWILGIWLLIPRLTYGDLMFACSYVSLTKLDLYSAMRKI